MLNVLPWVGVQPHMTLSDFNCVEIGKSATLTLVTPQPQENDGRI